MEQLVYLDKFIRLYGINGLADYETKITVKQYPKDSFLKTINAEIPNLKKYFKRSTLNLKRKNDKIDNVPLALSILKKCLTKTNIPYECVHTSTKNYMRLIPVNKLLYIYINKMNNIVHDESPATNRFYRLVVDKDSTMQMITGIQIEPENIEKLHSLVISIGGSQIWNLDFAILRKLGTYDGVSLTWPTRIFFANENEDSPSNYINTKLLLYQYVEVNVKTMVRDEHLPYELILKHSTHTAIDTESYIYQYRELEKNDTQYECSSRLVDGFFILSSNLSTVKLMIDDVVQDVNVKEVAPELYWLSLRQSKHNWDINDIEPKQVMSNIINRIGKDEVHIPNIFLNIDGDAKVYMQVFNLLFYSQGMAGTKFAW